MIVKKFHTLWELFMYIKENIHDTNEKFYLIKNYLCKYILYHISKYLFYTIIKITIYAIMKISIYFIKNIRNDVHEKMSIFKNLKL
jgi:hypothetical protein